MPNPVPEDGQAGPIVAKAVERLAAARIAVGLRPLAVLGLYGLVQSVRHGLQPPDHVVLLIGAVLSMAAMVAYGIHAVSRVQEKMSRLGGLFFAGSFVPTLFAGYVIVTGILHLFQLGGERGLAPAVIDLGLMVLAAMCLRAQWKLTEVHMLAREMAGLSRMNLDRGVP